MSKNVELGNLYEMNQAMIRGQETLADLSLLDEVAPWAMKTLKNNKHHYFMFLCREKSDYTIFRIAAKEEGKFKRQLTRLAYSRGVPVGINYNEVLNGYEFWIKGTRNKEEVHMYALFNCDDFVIEIGE